MAPMLRGRVARHVWSAGHLDNVKNAKDVKWQAESSLTWSDARAVELGGPALKLAIKG
jgi:hypothetical protein